jgi:hypothetical protein
MNTNLIALRPSSPIEHDSKFRVVSLLKFCPTSMNALSVSLTHCFRFKNSMFGLKRQSFLQILFKKMLVFFLVFNYEISKEGYFMASSVRKRQFSSLIALRKLLQRRAMFSTTNTLTSFWKLNKSTYCQLLPSNANEFQY